MPRVEGVRFVTETVGKPTLACIVITKDEERNISDCLSSARWADDIIVVDAESPDSSQICAQAADLRVEEARRDAAGREKRRKAVKVREAYTNRRPMYLGIVPGNREENRGIQEITEVIPIVRVLPKIIRIHDQVLSKGLLKTCMEFIALPWKNRSRRPKEGRGYGITHGAGQDQVLVEGGLHHASV